MAHILTSQQSVSLSAMTSPCGSSASLAALPVELMLNISSNLTSAKE